MKKLLIIPLVLVSNIIADSTFSIQKIEPPNWWAGMKHSNIQLMVYGSDLQGAIVESNNTDLIVEKVYEVNSKNYLFIDLKISNNTKPGEYLLSFKKGSEAIVFPYTILKRELSPEKHQGFDQSDVIYLITPDRFVNADTTNDKVDSYDQRFGRDDRLARHGGDLAGIISKLDYIKALGFTAIWINPLIENNMFISYHGYSATNFYKIDPRFGNNELYKNLVVEAHSRGLKIIMDHVSNHIADNHPWIRDLPEKDWLNGSKKSHLTAQHHKTIIPDNHAPPQEKEKLLNGWFMDFLPDLNQQNPFLANYLIQNTIWWIEFSGIDGIREDTYPYVDAHFLAIWAKAVFDDYPDFKIVGEIWDGHAATLSFFQSGTPLKREVDTNLPYVTDFNLTYAFGDYLSGRSDLSVFYKVFEQDFVYNHPEDLLTFIDNHDVLRAAYLSRGINDKLKIALQVLLTTRGIPQIYYGTEIGIIGDKDHGDIRADFPGGFPGDESDLFISENRSEKENGLFNLIKQIINIRSSEPALQYGQLIHYPVTDNLYVYKRVFNQDEILVIVNGNDLKMKIPLDYYQVESSATDLKTEKKVVFSGNTFTINPLSVVLLKYQDPNKSE